MDGNYAKPKSVLCSENLNFKSGLSPFEDFMQRTLTALNGMWSRLNYIRELRNENGNYQHWGLVQKYGDAAIQSAIADVHSELYLQVLRTPLSELLEQLPCAAQDADCSPAQLADQLYVRRRRLVPQDFRGGAPEHLRSVLLITGLLARKIESNDGQK